MKDIAIFGAGGFGKEIACVISKTCENNKNWQFIGFFDDNEPVGYQVSNYGYVIGNMDKLNTWPQELAVVIAIGDPRSLKSVRERIFNPNIFFPNIIEHNFKIADTTSFKIGVGNIIRGGSFASCDVEIGDFNVLNGSVVIGHDGKLEITMSSCLGQGFLEK